MTLWLNIYCKKNFFDANPNRKHGKKMTKRNRGNSNAFTNKCCYYFVVRIISNWMGCLVNFYVGETLKNETKYYGCGYWGGGQVH